MLTTTKRQFIIGTPIVLAGTLVLYVVSVGNYDDRVNGLLLRIGFVLFTVGFLVLYAAVRSAVAQLSNKPSGNIKSLLTADGWKVSEADRVKNPALFLPPHLLRNISYKPVEILWSAKRVIDSQTFEIFFRKWKYISYRGFETWWTTFDLHVTLPTALPGWVMAKPFGWDENISIKAGTQLESNDFNDQIDLKAVPDKLAFTVFPPDIMNWYLTSSGQPLIHVEGNSFVMMPNDVYENKVEKIHQQVVQTILDIQHLQKSL